jgi:hypothetical protein
LNIVILDSGTGSHSCITPLSPAEQSALLAFAQGGGTVVILTDNDTFCSDASMANNSLLMPFGLHATGQLNGNQQMTFHVSSAVSNGPFGTFTTAETNYPGWFDNVGSATQLATFDANNEPSSAILSAGALGAASGNIVFFSDSEFMMDTSGNDRTAMLNAVALATNGNFNVLYTFNGTADGARPDTGVVIDAGGKLYGTAFVAGAGYGTVFQLKPHGSSWIFSVLYTFTGSDGAGPLSRVVFGPDGALYGSTAYGGIGTCSYQGDSGCGTIYKLQPPATFCRAISCPWIEHVLYHFTGSTDGWAPAGDPVFDAAGSLYGIAEFGGAYPSCNGGFGCGVVFKLTPSGTQSVLWNFAVGSGGYLPTTGVVFDPAGNLYGTTYSGGTQDCNGFGCGTVYQLALSGSGWNENVLYSYTGGSDGFNPWCGVLLDSAGNVYSTAYVGGSGGGTVSELSPSGGTWTFNLLASLSGTAGQRLGNLIMDHQGNIYGATNSDGQYGFGSVFRLTPSNGSWTYASLHDFTGGADGANPTGTLTFDSAGNLYGTARAGGHTNDCSGAGCGVVWEITNP